MRAAYIGNVGENSAPHSTENHVARALRTIGVDVVPVHEQRFTWTEAEIPGDVDFVVWTHTHGFAPPKTHHRQTRFLDAMRRQGVPVVSYHLDRWWDLHRQYQLNDEPFFRTDLVCTADGGNQDRWAALGVNHVWFPPGVSEAECSPGTRRAAMASEIAFVGSWQGGYHPEHRHRSELVKWLKETYGDRCRFWPLPGEHAVRGEMLRDLYASVKVLVGDSCFAGSQHATNYWSDRLPETLGRGGFLLHPETPGLEAHFTPGEHLLTWPAGDWDTLANVVDASLIDDDMRHQVATAGRLHVLEHHTYERRMTHLLSLMGERGLINPVAA